MRELYRPTEIDWEALKDGWVASFLTELHTRLKVLENKNNTESPTVHLIKKLDTNARDVEKTEEPKSTKKQVSNYADEALALFPPSKHKITLYPEDIVLLKKALNKLAKLETENSEEKNQ